jgi:hypothetical protein
MHRRSDEMRRMCEEQQARAIEGRIHGRIGGPLQKHLNLVEGLKMTTHEAEHKSIRVNVRRRRPASLLAPLGVFVVSGLASQTLHAGTLPFGVVGTPIDLSANVSEHLQPGNATVFEQSQPLFGTTPNPKQSAELLHLSGTGVNGSGRSNNIQNAFASSLSESDGNGGVGVSQLIFGPAGTNPNATRQMAATSLWTQTFRNNGSAPVQITLHLHIPDLQVGLLGVAPRRDAPSSTETAEASATVLSTITHPDLTQIQGSKFEFGLHEFERQIPSGTDLVNFGDIKVLGQTGSVASQILFNGDDFNPSFTIPSVSTDVKLASLQPGDTLSYVYTLIAAGTTHGFEHGTFAFLGDPFGADVVGGNLGVTVSLIAPTPLPSAALLFGSALAGLGFFGRRRVSEIFSEGRGSLAAAEAGGR